MFKFPAYLLLGLLPALLSAQRHSVTSPDGELTLTVSVHEGTPFYTVEYSHLPMLEASPLGLVTTAGDFSREMQITGTKEAPVEKDYSMDRIKNSYVRYRANQLTVSMKNKDNRAIDVVFQVSNNNIGFYYKMPLYGETAWCTVQKEATGFNFPDKTTTFLTPQATPGIGWKNSKPSYEEEYVPDEPVGTTSKYGLGYTFPCLFRIGDDGWVLLSETGVRSLYCGSRLDEATTDGIYTLSYPDPGENNGIGASAPSMSLPGKTPWRTITIGNDLKPIVETTIPFDLVEPLYEASQKYEYGRSTWSWILWQDRSMNYDDQVTYINLSAEMGYEYILIDALWDTQVGYDRMPALIDYAHSKGVDVFLWYNSNGYWNNAPQGPKNKMSNSVARKKEMKWLKDLGVKGLKVDFFGGDKQVTMQLYEDILTDANEYGLMVIFHGATLPRGWERMFPNYVGSEAVLASENLIFSQHFDDMEAQNACLHPFIRNTVGSMEFGPVLLNRRLNRTNDGGTIRRTSDGFQLATAVLFQNPVQMFAIAPNNLAGVPAFEIDFMKKVPTTWDETLFIDGYPGKYCILARRHGSDWYVAGVNAERKPVSLHTRLPMFAGKTVTRIADSTERVSFRDRIKVKKSGELQIGIQPGGGFILMDDLPD